VLGRLVEDAFARNLLDGCRYDVLIAAEGFR
jgi:hypothetical protein